MIKNIEIHPRVTEIDVSGFGVIWSYLIRGKNTAIIDTGPIRSPEKYIAPALEKLGMTLTDIDVILNTHIHFDHTGGDAELKSVRNVPIFMHTDDAIYLENPELLFEADIAPAVEVIMGKEHIEEEKKRYMEMVQPGKDTVVDRGLKDNEIIELGEGCDLKVMHLPGHTRGSIGFYMEEDSILFSGDAMQGVCEHDGGLPIIDDLAAHEASIERVQGVTLKALVNSHPFRGITTPPSTLLRGEEINTFLEECREFTRRLREAAKSVAPYFSKKPFYELYDEVVSRFPEEWGLKPSSQIGKQFFGPTTLLNCIKQIEK